MQTFSILLALAAVASAIDIIAYADIPRFSHCEGQSLVSWIGVAADTCYSTSNYLYALQFVAIPTNWHIITRSYGALSCPSNKLINQFHSDGRSSVCHGSPNGDAGYRGGGYSFENTKRSEGADSSDQGCIGPDLVHLVDGRDYAVTNVEDKIVQEIIDFAANGTISADMPEKFDKYIAPIHS